MHSPLEIARNFVEIGIHKVKLSAWKMLILGFFAGMFIGFAGIASTTASATIASASVVRLVSACVFPAGMAMVLVAGSELFTGNNLIIISVLQKKTTVAGMLRIRFIAVRPVVNSSSTSITCAARRKASSSRTQR